MISIVLFILLLSSGSVFGAARYGKKYEETIPLTVFCSVELVFLFGLLNNLKLGFWVLCASAAVLYVLGIGRILREKSFRRVCTDLFTPAFFILIALMAIYAYAIVGRVACRNDEFSYWATSVKKMWYLNMLPCVPEAEPYFAEYPPGMQIFQYILQALKGSFTEWRINFAYVTYIFILFLPFLKELRHRQVFKNLLVAGVVFSCGTIIYSYALDNLMVDFALGVTFAYGFAMIFLLEKRGGRWNSFTIAHIILAANMLILIKPAGELLATFVLVALALTLCKSLRRKNLVDICRQNPPILLLLGGFLLPIATAVLWKVKYTYYQTHVAFENSYDLKGFVRILLGGGSGYRVQIRNGFLNFLISEKIQIGPLSLTNQQFTGILLALIFLLWYLYRNSKSAGKSIAVGVLIAGIPIYWLGLMASYMYTFSEREGVVLASLQRYLNIYFTGLLLFFILLLLHSNDFLKGDIRLSCCVLLLVLCFVSYPDLVNLLTRHVTKASISQRASYQEVADQIVADPSPKSEDGKNTVLLIHEDGYPHIPVNQFAYMLWPSYQVPWECSYGSQSLFEGDTYTQIFTAEEFRRHVLDLGVDYIAVELLNDDFVGQYSDLFDAPLKNGQVYKVSDNPQFTLLTIQGG